MVSEIENIKKGLVVSTSDYDNNKKIIGVNNGNITPDENGICPLGKQGAFIKEEAPIETFEEVSALDSIENNNAVEETLDFSAPTPAPVGEPEKAAEAPKFVLPEATVSDTTMENPVEVAPNDALNTLIVEAPKPIEEAAKEEPVTEAEVELQMPVMDEEVLASEPTGIDNSLFENMAPGATPFEEPKPEAVDKPVEQAPEPEVPTPAPVGETKPVEEETKLDIVNPTEKASETPAPAVGADVDAAKINELVGKMLDELALKVSKHIKEDIEEYKNNLNNLLLNKEVEQKEEAPKPETVMNSVSSLESNVMNDAINQINNMVIPELDVPTL